MEVAIDLIKPSLYQPRLTFDVEDIRGSIVRDGIRVALTVRQKDDYYELIDGERRLRLAKELGYKTVPCDVINVDDETARRLVWQVNTLRKAYAPKEIAHHFKTLQEMGLSIRAIGRECGYSDTEVRAYLSIFKLPGEYQEYIWLRKIGVGDMVEVLPLFNDSAMNIAPITDWLDQRLSGSLRSATELREALHPTLEKLEAKRVQKAQEAVGEIAPEITLESPEDYERAAELLRREARRKAEEAMTPEEKAAQEAEKRAKAETQAAIRAQREEERKRQKEEEGRRLEERAMRKARTELAKNPDFVSQVIREQQFSLDISVPRQAREEIQRKEGIVYTVGEFDCPNCRKHVSIKCDGKRHWGE